MNPEEGVESRDAVVLDPKDEDVGIPKRELKAGNEVVYRLYLYVVRKIRRNPEEGVESWRCCC